jgi:cystathionine gamma-synthase
MAELDLHAESVAVAAGRPHEPGAPLNTPVVLAAPFRHTDEDNAYQREAGTDTIRAFEAAVGALDGGEAIAFASGMAAAAAVIEGLHAGSVVVAPTQAYSGAVSIFAEQERLGRLTVRRVDSTDTTAVVQAADGAQLVWLEAITNPLIGVVDVPAIAAAAPEAVVAVDATFTTPLNFRPLAVGADITMHSSTKFIAGHSDLTSGVLVTSPERATPLRERRALTGGTPGALETYLALRGLRTLAVRFERAQQNAAVLATRLAAHRAVTRVRYPGLPGDPFHERAARLHAGFGAVLAFELADADAAELACARVRLITHCTSLGGVETTMERRARYAVDARYGTPASLIRLSVGIEHVDDLWADLAAALG